MEQKTILSVLDTRKAALKAEISRLEADAVGFLSVGAHDTVRQYMVEINRLYTRLDEIEICRQLIQKEIRE